MATAAEDKATLLANLETEYKKAQEHHQKIAKQANNAVSTDVAQIAVDSIKKVIEAIRNENAILRFPPMHLNEVDQQKMIEANVAFAELIKERNKSILESFRFHNDLLEALAKEKPKKMQIPEEKLSSIQDKVNTVSLINTSIAKSISNPQQFNIEEHNKLLAKVNEKIERTQSEVLDKKNKSVRFAKDMSKISIALFLTGMAALSIGMSLCPPLLGVAVGLAVVGLIYTAVAVAADLRGDRIFKKEKTENPYMKSAATFFKGSKQGEKVQAVTDMQKKPLANTEPPTPPSRTPSK